MGEIISKKEAGCLGGTGIAGMSVKSGNTGGSWKN